MLCSFARLALPAVILVDVLVNSHYSHVHAALPPGAEDEIVLIEHLPGRRVHLEEFFGRVRRTHRHGSIQDEIVLIEHLPGRRVHLEDFFWTGAEDAPAWLDPDQTLTLYETRTVHHTATVYLPEDGSSVSPGCTSCINPTPSVLETDQNIGVLFGEDPGPRYWLLTVLRSGENVPPKVELRLARLYRAAFTRQQQRHLGLLPNDPRLRRAATKRPPFSSQQIHHSNDSETSQRMEKEAGMRSETKIQAKTMRLVRIPKNRRNTEVLENHGKAEVISMETGSSLVGPRGIRYPELTASPTNGTSIRESRALDVSTNSSKSKPNVALVQVRMQNMSVTETGSTKLIYSVHLGGKPVPAETAAKDMALLSPQEVALELGVPVIVQSEPYLKESRPLALSRKRDAWLLIGAAGSAIILVTLLIASLLLVVKRKRAHSAVSVPPPTLESILKKDRGYSPTSVGLDNTGYTSETEPRTEAGTSQRQTPASLSGSPVTPLTPDTLHERLQRSSSTDDERGSPSSWRLNSPSSLQKPRTGREERRRMRRRDAIDEPGTPDSLESELDENVQPRDLQQLEECASPHSYLSMPSCKLFPNMRSVEPLSKILEPVVVKHLDLEFDSPTLPRRANGTCPRYHEDDFEDEEESSLARTTSALEDPGVLGPIVSQLRRHRTLRDSGQSENGEARNGGVASGPVGRARRRLHELLEDSFGLFGSSREPRSSLPTSLSSRPNSGATLHQPHPITFLQSRGKSAHVTSPVGTPVKGGKTRPRTSLAHPGHRERNVEDGVEGGKEEEDGEEIERGSGVPQHPRGAWGSRPLSAGPFHRPNLPEIDVNRVLADHQLPPEDPAVPLIAAIRKELEKFTPETRPRD